LEGKRIPPARRRRPGDRRRHQPGWPV